MAKVKASKSAKKPVKKATQKSAKKPAAPAKKAAKPAPKISTTKKAVKPAAKASKPILKVKAKSTTNNNVNKMPQKPTKPATKATAKPAAAKAPAPVKPAARPVKKLSAGRVIIAAGYKPNDKEEYMSGSQLEYFRQKLTKWKDELSNELKETLDNLKEENWQESDIADRATVETDASLELRTRDRYRKLINKINDAIQRIERGEYGYCEETGEEIGLKRLEARPIATLSIEAQERHERDERTHYDEDLEERLA